MIVFFAVLNILTLKYIVQHSAFKTLIINFKVWKLRRNSVWVIDHLTTTTAGAGDQTLIKNAGGAHWALM